MRSMFALVLILCCLTFSTLATPTQDDVAQFQSELEACTEADQCTGLLQRFGLKEDQRPFHLTLPMLEHIGELIHTMDPSRSIQIHPTELEIDFYDGEEKWSFLSTPLESYCSSSFGQRVDSIVEHALDPHKQPFCHFEGCWGDCNGYDSDHEHGWCDHCTRAVGRCDCK